MTPSREELERRYEGVRRSPKGPDPRPVAERLAEHIDWEAEGECWICTYGKGRSGYPTMRIGSRAASRGDRQRTASAHRIAYELYVGPIQDGLLVLHHCDNPACVNPDHLYPGTNQDNMDDKMRRGRWRGNSTRKVSGEDAVRVREMYSTGQWTQKELAVMCGVSETLVSLVVNRKRRFAPTLLRSEKERLKP